MKEIKLLILNIITFFKQKWRNRNLLTLAKLYIVYIDWMKR